MLQNLSIGKRLALIALVPCFFFLVYVVLTTVGGDDSSSSSERNQYLFLLLALVGGLGASWFVGRGVIDSLTQLRDEASNVAASDLPRLGDALTNGTPFADSAFDRDPLDLGENEFGEVAASLAAVRDSAASVGERATALQSGISDTFVNLARRNQSLVDRQLEAIDTLEAEERDADRLALMYRVDHLATRMRRNAESLLVLADAKAPERHSAAVELREVLRVAMGEVEDYRRIVPISLDDLHVAGPKAQDLAHLLAELMENAAQHSPPGTAVDVTGAFDPASGGYRVTVLDHGTGVEPAQLMELNNLLQRPPTSTLTISHSIGLQVVSRLAHSLGVQVVLNHAADGGVVATVSIPAAVVSEWGQTAPQGANTPPNAAPGIVGLGAPATAVAAMPAAIDVPSVDPGLDIPDFSLAAEAPAAPAPSVDGLASFDGGLQMPAPEPVPTLDMPSLGLPSLGLEPELSSPDLSAPDLPMPDVAMPDVAMPDMALTTPDISAPDVAIPDLALPTPDLPAPELAMPDLAMPDLAMPDLAMPDAATPDLAMPDVAIPDLALPTPDLPAPELPTPDLAMPDVAIPDLALPTPDLPAPEAPPVFEPAAEAPPVFEPAPVAPPVFEPAAEAPPVFEPAPAPATFEPAPAPAAFEPAPAPAAFEPAPAPAAFEPAPAPVQPPAMPEPMAQPAPAPMPAPAPVQPAAMPEPMAQPAPAMPAAAPVAEAPVAAKTASGLTKRKRSSATTESVDLEADRTAPSQRTPDQVKNMLSRYKTGLERGRGSAGTDGE